MGETDLSSLGRRYEIDILVIRKAHLPTLKPVNIETVCRRRNRRARCQDVGISVGQFDCTSTQTRADMKLT